MREYLDLLKRVIEHGEGRPDRTGTGTYSTFGEQIRIDLRAGFPLLTLRALQPRTVIAETLFFLRGETNVAWLHDRGVRIWDPWARRDGSLGPVYGRQWRAWPEVERDGQGHAVLKLHDQIDRVLTSLRLDPFSRRHVVSAWNVGALDRMVLPPCHVLFQFYVSNPAVGPKRLSCHLYQRSADLLVGVPHNVAGYALLTHLLAAQLDYGVGDLIVSFGDCHVYQDHAEQAGVLLQRRPLPPPTLRLRRPFDSLDSLDVDDIVVEHYHPHPPVRLPVAV